jgi:hypothetical protein
MNTEMPNPEARCEVAAGIIREKSRAGQLTSVEDILDDAVAPAEGKLSEGGQGDALKDLLEIIMEENKDLREIRSRDGARHCYSTIFMTGVYAGMLLKKEEDPLRLIADLVRENAAQYPRPTSIDFLRSSPFEMSQEEIFASLQNMAAEEEYKDIERLSTSAGTVFLYSTLHLDPAHASMLAEWIDVGQFENP